ncbi:COV 1-like protein [Tanacetum coccineum]
MFASLLNYKIVWFNHLIPRQAFILWMAMQDKLLTQDKIEKWNHDGDFKCGLKETLECSEEKAEVKKLSLKSSMIMLEGCLDMNLDAEFRSLQRALYLGNKNHSLSFIPTISRNGKLLSSGLCKLRVKGFPCYHKVGCLLWLEAILVMPLLLVMVDSSEGNVAKRDCFPEQLLLKQYMLLMGLDLSLGFVTSVTFIFVVGIFMSSWLGASVLSLGEWFIKRMPFVRHIYDASKQISAAISPDQNSRAFQEVVIIKHPRAGEYAFGFITSNCGIGGHVDATAANDI